MKQDTKDTILGGIATVIIMIIAGFIGYSLAPSPEAILNQAEYEEAEKAEPMTTTEIYNAVEWCKQFGWDAEPTYEYSKYSMAPSITDVQSIINIQCERFNIPY